MKPALLLTAGLLAMAPGAATAQNAVAIPVAAAGLAAASQPLPIVSGLTPDQRSRYRAIFAAIDGGDWATAQAGIDAIPNGPLDDIARAQLLLAKGSPKASDEALTALLARASDLPQALELAAIASRRGLSAPALPVVRDMVRFAGPSKRQTARAARNDRAAAALQSSAMPLLRNDQPSAGEAIVNGQLSNLSPEAQAEWLQRVAWSYYLAGDDANARRVADQARAGTGDWSVQASWVSGLAAWRQKDCLNAGIAFGQVSSHARDPEMIAAGLYWASRADMACNHPERVETRLRSAARMKETFYGLISQAALGLSDDGASATKLTANDWSAIGAIPNVRRATALAEIGETKLAEQLLRHQAKIGHSRDHESRSGLPRMAPRAPGCRPPRAIRCRPGRRPRAGRSTRRWSSPTRFRNRSFASTPPARRARAG